MLRLIVTLVFLVLLIAFNIFNQDKVPINLFFASKDTSVGVVVLIVAVLFFFLGAFILWLSAMKQWRRARKAEQKNTVLEQQILEIQAKMAALPVSYNTVSQAAEASSLANGATLPGTSGVPTP